MCRIRVVPGYRLCRPRSTSSGQALRDCFPDPSAISKTGPAVRVIESYSRGMDSFNV
jgi:hypothetical protein